MRDLYLIHGWGSNAAVWSPLTRCLDDRCRIHALDIPGFGARAACPVENFEQAADSLMKQIPRMAHVVAWSMGGLFALGEAADDPARFSRLDLIGGFPRYTRDGSWTRGGRPGHSVRYAEGPGR